MSIQTDNMEKFADYRNRMGRYHNMKPIVTLRELLLILFGLFPYGLAVNQMLVPHNVVSGGLTGFCEILYFVTDTFVPIWLSSFLVNGVLLLVAWKLVDRRFCLRTLYGFSCLTFWFKVIPIASEPMIHEPFMASIVGGLLCGCGLGIVFLNNGSSGGTDIVAAIVNKYRHVPLGRVLFYCDLIIISSAYFLPNVRDVEKVLFGLCFTFMCTNAVDMIMNKVRQSVQFFIFSQKYEQIADAINTQVLRGVTVLEGMGWYSKEKMHVVTVLAKKNESKKIFALVKEIDPDAFVSQSEAIGVYGRGFDPIQK